MTQSQYYVTIRYQHKVVYDFQAIDTLAAIAKLSRLIEEEFPYAHGSIIEANTGKVIYQCTQRAIC